MLRFQERFGRTKSEKTFDQDFFDFTDPLHPWTTIYRFLLFFDLKHGIQAMVGFGQQKGEGHTINGLDANFHVEGSRFKVPVSYWFFKDELIHDTEYLSFHAGEDSLESKDFAFSMDGEGYRMRFKPLEADISMQGEKDINYQHYNMGYVPFGRYNCYIPYKGNIKGMDSEGYAFVQKVNHNMPFIPWRWGRAFFEDGSRLVFFEPRPGFKLFKSLSMTRNGEKYVFDQKTRIDMEKDEELPRWSLSGETKAGERMRLEGQGLAKAENKFETKRSYFSYNEYPSRILEMEFEDPSGKIVLNDMGRSSFNTEDAYYVKMI